MTTSTQQKFEKLHTLSQWELREKLLSSSNLADTAVIEYIIKTPQLRGLVDDQMTWVQVLTTSCAGGNLKAVEFVVNCEELKEYAKVFASNQYGLSQASILGQNNVLKYLLQMKEIRQSESFFKMVHFCFLNACALGNLEIVTLLLETPEYKKCINLHTKQDSAVQNACQYRHYHIMEYLIFKHNLKKTSFLYHYIKKHPIVANWFAIRDEHTKVSRSTAAVSGSEKENKKIKFKL